MAAIEWTRFYADVTRVCCTGARATVNGRTVEVREGPGPFHFWRATADGEPLAIGAHHAPAAAQLAAERAALALPPKA